MLSLHAVNANMAAGADIAADVADAVPAVSGSPQRSFTSIPSEELRLSAAALTNSSPVFARSVTLEQSRHSCILLSNLRLSQHVEWQMV